MAQALIKSTSNNKPPQQCAGSERAVRWQEPRGSSRRARAKRELCPRRGYKGAGGEGLAGAGAAGTFPESWQGPEGLLGDEMVASCFGRRFQEFGCCGGVSWAGSSATGQGFCLKKKRGGLRFGDKKSPKSIGGEHGSEPRCAPGILFSQLERKELFNFIAALIEQQG